jgi:hypothetical protein
MDRLKITNFRQKPTSVCHPADCDRDEGDDKKGSAHAEAGSHAPQYSGGLRRRLFDQFSQRPLPPRQFTRRRWGLLIVSCLRQKLNHATNRACMAEASPSRHTSPLRRRSTNWARLNRRLECGA